MLQKGLLYMAVEAHVNPVSRAEAMELLSSRFQI